MVPILTIVWISLTYVCPNVLWYLSNSSARFFGWRSSLSSTIIDTFVPPGTSRLNMVVFGDIPLPSPLSLISDYFPLKLSYFYTVLLVSPTSLLLLMAWYIMHSVTGASCSSSTLMSASAKNSEWFLYPGFDSNVAKLLHFPRVIVHLLFPWFQNRVTLRASV